MVRMQEVAAEAICSALYSMPFTRFLGERPGIGGEGDVAWFRLSEDPSAERINVRENPKVIRVSVQQQQPDLVVVHAEWPNVSAGIDQLLMGGQTFRISCTHGEDHIRQACEEVVVRVLEIFKDVLSGSGVAGPVAALAPASEYEETETDMAKTDEEVGRE